MCGKGFDQKSRLERHVETSHPKPAPSAADLEKALWYRLSKDKTRIGSTCSTKHLFITRRAP
jgi:macrodomain Ter protein organizer (MatP/YcbG family)